jgi:hypothetical protein
MEPSEKPTIQTTGLQYSSFWADMLDLVADSIDSAVKTGLAKTATEAAVMLRDTAEWLRGEAKDG